MRLLDLYQQMQTNTQPRDTASLEKRIEWLEQRLEWTTDILHAVIVKLEGKLHTDLDGDGRIEE
jgi:hypothetical protein